MSEEKHLYITLLSYFRPYVCGFYSNTREINFSPFPLSIDKSAFAVVLQRNSLEKEASRHYKDKNVEKPISRTGFSFLFLNEVFLYVAVHKKLKYVYSELQGKQKAGF